MANVSCLSRVRSVRMLLISGLGILSSCATGSTLVLVLSWRCWLCMCAQLSLVSPEELSFLILTWRVGEPVYDYLIPEMSRILDKSTQGKTNVNKIASLEKSL